VEGWLTAPIILNNLIAANGAYTGGGVCLVDSILPFEVPKLINNTILPITDQASIFTISLRSLKTTS